MNKISRTDDLLSALMGALFEPQWKGPIEGYTVNYMIAQHWRVEKRMERDDFMQEAYCVFLKIKREYKVRNAAHFMALYKSALRNKINDLAQACRYDVYVVSDVEEHEDGSVSVTLGEIENDGYLATLIRQAPQEVLMVLNLMLRAPQEIVAEVLISWNGNGDARTKSNGSKTINRLLGLPLDQDTLGAVKSYFSA